MHCSRFSRSFYSLTLISTNYIANLQVLSMKIHNKGKKKKTFIAKIRKVPNNKAQSKITSGLILTTILSVARRAEKQSFCNSVDYNFYASLVYNYT